MWGVWRHCRLINLHVSRVLTGSTLILGDAELLAEVIEEARIEARESLKHYAYAEASEGAAYEQNPQQEVVN